MRQLLILISIILSLSLPAYVFAGEDLQIIKEKPATGKMYERALVFFTEKIPDAFKKQLDQSQKYIDLITEVFSDKDIPLDLVYLPLIESGFSPLSVGRGDAVGLWQFVKGTGRKYGLRIDGYVDERKDPVKSTYAAADYLKDLYQMFGAWDIALAAYNAGDGKVRHWLKKYNGVRLPEVVNSYLARFMAASDVAQDPKGYGLAPTKGISAGDDESDYTELITDKPMSLSAIALMYKTTVRIIRELNPALLGNTTPPYEYVLRLPKP